MLDRVFATVDRLWVRIAGGCLALALVIGAIAYASQPTERDYESVRNTLTDFVTAAGDRDGDAACKLLTPQGRQIVTAEVPGVSCETYARSFGFDVAGLGSVTLHLPADLPGQVLLDASNMTDPAGHPVQRKVLMVRTSNGYRIAAISR
ncbi:hypothetical protein NBH00_10445 [Paraconexibacter antarcticus]|uniref:Uncharacterized protein n=1 Tax=Paraconexibacter antarcticus TaxID=2949664 RepID=A0ABY5E1B2_9ACTN|nr:hypothetical protein [Paraconexibacter antarcticus]UTI66609.1 hypothetical protein NBH00_10445 [Paraconexibacter antarcticus]